jgi:hypothetical protein
MFVNKKYADISGIIACTSDRSEEPILCLDVVHNHFTKVPIPRGFFGANADEMGHGAGRQRRHQSEKGGSERRCARPIEGRISHVIPILSKADSLGIPKSPAT